MFLRSSHRRKPILLLILGRPFPAEEQNFTCPLHPSRLRSTRSVLVNFSDFFGVAFAGTRVSVVKGRLAIGKHRCAGESELFGFISCGGSSVWRHAWSGVQDHMWWLLSVSHRRKVIQSALRLVGALGECCYGFEVMDADELIYSDDCSDEYVPCKFRIRLRKFPK